MTIAKNILITGANRGIGLEFVHQYANQGHNVYATSRDNYRSEDLRQLQQKPGPGKITILPLEVTDAASRSNMKKLLGDTPLDLFIHNAGIYGPRGVPLGEVDERVWLQVLHVNVVSPLKMVAQLRSNLIAAGEATVAVLSSKMGSIADNSSGGNYMYRSSKAALNCVAKTMALDLASNNIKVVSLHPGWVKTEMGGPNALIDTATSVTGMVKVLEALTREQCGLFINYDGTVIPW